MLLCDVRDLPTLGREEVAKLREEHTVSEPVALAGGCSGSCGKVSTTTSSAEEKKKEESVDSRFAVTCITVSDRAYQGLYPDGDLSGKAMQECIDDNQQHFRSIRSR